MPRQIQGGSQRRYGPGPATPRTPSGTPTAGARHRRPPAVRAEAQRQFRLPTGTNLELIVPVRRLRTPPTITERRGERGHRGRVELAVGGEVNKHESESQ